jgi:hypothetical protein
MTGLMPPLSLRCSVCQGRILSDKILLRSASSFSLASISLVSGLTTMGFLIRIFLGLAAILILSSMAGCYTLIGIAREL